MFLPDPMYLLLVALPALLLSGGASLLVRSAFNRYSQIPTRRGVTGAQAAEFLLERAGIHDVRIVPTHGFLGDHYNPVTKELALSPEVYGSTSVAAVGVATHEAGHALQHAENYGPLWLRSALVPTVGFGSNGGLIAMMIGMVLHSSTLVLIGAGLFSLVLLFQLVTLPVEFDASSRAKRLVLETGLVTRDEQDGVSSVLNAAALTYVAAAVSTLLTLVYYLARAGLLGGNRDE